MEPTNIASPMGPAGVEPTPRPAPESEPSRKTSLSDINKTSWLALVVLAAVTAGVWYYYAYYSSSALGPSPSVPSRETVAAYPDEATAALKEQGASDEVDDIERDLNATGLDDLDRELADINAQL